MRGKHASVAKISRPKSTRIFVRKRLFRLLDTCRKHRLVWITGPAGSGKTTLVSSYLDANRLPCLWYRVDQGDSDIASFFSYMSMAARKAAPRRRTPLPSLTPEYLRGIPTFTKRYFENLFTRFKIPYVFVFDNYHSVPADSNFHTMMSDGLSTVPDGINVILISRYDLPPTLSRLHANGQMGMLEWNELRLSLEESAGIVRLRKKGKTPKEVIQRLHETADGWAAGLVLMLESLKRGIEPHLLGKLTPEEIVDYFGNEFFNKISKEMQDFLLKTAFLPKITVRMAEKLTGLLNADKILLRLSRNNYFTEKHYSPEPLYQYHPLLKEFLMARAKETFSNEALSALCRQAAVVLEEAGWTEAAACLFRDIGDWGAMVPLLMEQAPSMLSQGRYRPLEEWLGSLPKEMLESDPWLLYWEGESRFPFDPSVTRSYFEKAFNQFKVQGDLTGMLLAWSGVVGSILWGFQDFSHLDQWIQIFPELPENPEESIPPEVWLRVVSSMLGARTLCRRYESAETEKWIRRASSILQGPGSLFVKAPILFAIVHWNLVMGDYEESFLALRSLQQLAQSKEASPLVLILTRTAEAMYYQLTGDHEKCLKAVSEGLKTSEDTGIFFLEYTLMEQAVSSCQNMGDLELAQTMLDKIDSSRDRLRPIEKGYYHFCQSRQFLLRSELSAASAQVELALKTAMDSSFYVGLALTYLLAAQVMHRVGKHQEAWNYLHEAFGIAERYKSKTWKYCGLMIEANFHFDQGDEASGLASLRKALTIGKERGFLNTLVDQSAVSARLCVKALEEDIEVPYVQDIIRKRRLIPEKPPLHLDNWPWPLKIFTLGRFGLLRDGKPVRFSKKIQERPLSLVKILIALGGREVEEEDIADLLWPETDGDLAQHSFEMTLHRLRTLVGYPDAFKLRDGRLTMEQRYCWVDVWAFERLLGEADVKRKEGLAEKAAELTQRAIEVYKGPFLFGEARQPFVISFRERLRSKFSRNICWLGSYWEEANKWEDALKCYQRGLEVDNISEELYRRLMLCHKRLGQKAEALSVYKRCERMLRAGFEIEPSPKTQALYKTLSSPNW